MRLIVLVVVMLLVSLLVVRIGSLCAHFCRLRARITRRNRDVRHFASVKALHSSKYVGWPESSLLLLAVLLGPLLLLFSSSETAKH